MTYTPRSEYETPVVVESAKLRDFDDERAQVLGAFLEKITGGLEASPQLRSDLDAIREAEKQAFIQSGLIRLG